MNWTMPYPWRSRCDRVRRINMSSEPGNESFFCALRPIPRILSLRRRDYACQVRDVDTAGQPLRFWGDGELREKMQRRMRRPRTGLAAIPEGIDRLLLRTEDPRKSSCGKFGTEC